MSTTLDQPVTASVVEAALDTPRPDATGDSGADKLLALVFVVAVFLSSTLLFLVQPLIARLLLPLAGGSSALWNTAMVFFQLTLLLGYGFAHASLRKVGPRRHPILQSLVLVLPLAALPLAVPDGWALPNDVAPALWVLGALALIVGLPFFALATTSPTLQVWFSSTSHARAEDPYFLYAAGNIGSVLALIGYPLVLEPLFSLQTQTRIWAVGYVAFVLACAAAGLLTRRHQADALAPSEFGDALDATRLEDTDISNSRRARWLLWAFIPSALMLGVTLHIATDLASMPLLWVVPLLLYLVTFIIAFGKDSDTRVPRSATFVWFGIVPLALSFVFIGVLAVVFNLIWFFAGALLCHAKLAEDRPPASRLTEFYLILSIGGALGGIFASLLAPMIFASVYEYPIAIALVLLVAKRPEARSLSMPIRYAVNAGLVLCLAAVLIAPTELLLIGGVAALLVFLSHGPVATIILIVALLAAGPTTYSDGDKVLQDRSFFGVYSVEDDQGVRSIVSGTTTHGTQLLDQSVTTATTYYFEEGPVGQIFASEQPQDVAVIGLGAGTMAVYGQPGDNFTFFEIDQLVVDIASDPDLFTYLSDTEANVDIVVDDGRHGLAVSDQKFDLVVVDAFGSDAIPVHLLTAEALGVYLDHLSPGGTLLIHRSNRHFDLRSVIATGTASHGAQAYGQDYFPTAEALDNGATGSNWVAVAPEGSRPDWVDDGRFSALDNTGTLWTDDYSNVLSIMDW